MAQGRIELEHTPGTYVSGARARWLIQARRAEMSPSGCLRLLAGTPGAGRGRESGETEKRTTWSSYSGAGARNLSATAWLKGYRMNGAAINRVAL